MVVAYLEYLSSGENLAGCADLVTVPSSTFFSVCHRDVLVVDWMSDKISGILT
jgi:hypothetical protein